MNTKNELEAALAKLESLSSEIDDWVDANEDVYNEEILLIDEEISTIKSILSAVMSGTADELVEDLKELFYFNKK